MNAKRWLVLLVALVVVVTCAPAFAQVPASGPNMDPTLTPRHISVEFFPSTLEDSHWFLEDELVFDPHAPPMEKWFQSPVLTPSNPLLPGDGFPVWENFLIVPPSLSVLDWHEVIHTPGWEWRYSEYDPNPTDPNYHPLITRDGIPWPWQPQLPMPPGSDPNTMIWAEFPPIDPGHVLDIHKQLVWMGDPNNGNTKWGDGTNDDGTVTIPEQMITVWEYPTPEPSTLALVVLGALALVGVRRRLG